MSLALVADAWSRTYRSRAVTFAGSSESDRDSQRAFASFLTKSRRLAEGRCRRSVSATEPPALALDATLANIESRYGAGTRYVVAMQLEYPRLAATR